MIIPLGVQSPARSSSLPASSLSERVVPRRLFGLAPAGVYPATIVTDGAVRSYRTFSPLPVPTQASAVGGVFSVALSVTGPRSAAAPFPGVTWQPTLRSPDFPRADTLAGLSRDHPADTHHRLNVPRLRPVVQQRLHTVRSNGDVNDKDVTGGETLMASPE
jgi:hypothetical protein